MTHIDKYYCDNCKDEIELVECLINQRRFVLSETMDDGSNYDFCGIECLKEFINSKKFEDRFFRDKEKYPLPEQDAPNSPQNSNSGQKRADNVLPDVQDFSEDTDEQQIKKEIDKDYAVVKEVAP